MTDSDSEPSRLMTAEQVRSFIGGRILQAVDPDSGEVVATVTYGPDGACTVAFANGDTDEGSYGFVDHFYWTRYRRFRDGTENRFALEPLGTGKAQAWHDDGRRAFIQAVVDG